MLCWMWRHGGKHCGKSAGKTSAKSSRRVIKAGGIEGGTVGDVDVERISKTMPSSLITASNEARYNNTTGFGDWDGEMGDDGVSVKLRLFNQKWYVFKKPSC